MPPPRAKAFRPAGPAPMPRHLRRSCDTSHNTDTANSLAGVLRPFPSARINHLEYIGFPRADAAQRASAANRSAPPPSFPAPEDGQASAFHLESAAFLLHSFAATLRIVRSLRAACSDADLNGFWLAFSANRIRRPKHAGVSDTPVAPELRYGRARTMTHRKTVF